MPSFRITLRADFAANPSNAKAKLILLLFRSAHVFAAKKQTHPLLWCVGLPIMMTHRVVCEWVLSVELPARTVVGPGLKIMHGQGLVVNYASILGPGCTLRQCTTIGSKVDALGNPGPSPRLGSHVDVGCNAVILGDISIGDHAIIGAGSVVLKDVPAGAVVAGNPARVLRLQEGYPGMAGSSGAGTGMDG